MDITEGPSDDADRLLASDEPERPGRKQPVRKCYERVINRRWVELFGELWGEFIGTFFVVLVTLNINATDVTLQEEVGLWEIAIVTGLGVSIATYATSHFSNSHFNPALTLAFAIARWKVFSWKKVFPYIFVQLFAGFLAATVMYGLYGNTIARFENRMNITRGSEHSVFSAKVFVQYFPNPSFANETADIISPFSAFGTEAWAMGILAFMIFSFADPNNSSVGNRKNKDAVPLLVGLTTGLLVCLFSPLTQAGMNPAQDFGPRLFAAAAGWGRIAIPGPKNGFWVYIVGPLIGGPIGGLLYDFMVVRFILMKPEGVEN